MARQKLTQRQQPVPRPRGKGGHGPRGEFKWLRVARGQEGHQLLPESQPSALKWETMTPASLLPPTCMIH